MCQAYPFLPGRKQTKTSMHVQIVTSLTSEVAGNTGALLSWVHEALPLSQKTSKSFVPKWKFFLRLLSCAWLLRIHFPEILQMKVLQTLMIDLLAPLSFAGLLTVLLFSNELFGGEEKMRENPIYSLLLIYFILSPFLMKMNHRFSSLPQPFSIQFCIYSSSWSPFVYDCAFWILPPTICRALVMFLSVQALAELFLQPKLL